METTTQNSNSVAALLKDLREETTVLLRQEVALAKSELAEKASRMGKDATRLAMGAGVAYAGLIVLLVGLGALASWGLAEAGLAVEVAVWLGPAVVGLVVALIGWGMVSSAKRALREDTIVPEETLQSLRENKRWAQNKMGGASHEPAV